MNHDEAISVNARAELKRFCPNHYDFRGLTPEADLELSRLTRNEGGLPHRASVALQWQAMHQIALRKMLGEANPASDFPAPKVDQWVPPPLPSESVAGGVDALWKNYREAALAFAIELGNAQLIAAFQPLPLHEDGNAAWQIWSREYGYLEVKTSPDSDPARRLRALRELGGEATYEDRIWKFTRVVELARKEAAAGRSRSAEKTIRNDLRKAAESERVAKRAGESKESRNTWG